MEILHARLEQLAKQEALSDKSEKLANLGSATFGGAVIRFLHQQYLTVYLNLLLYRTYTLNPVRNVVDVRTGGNFNPDKLFEGDLDEMLFLGLKHQAFQFES